MARPGKYFRLFFREPAVRQRIWERFIHIKAIYSKGQGEVGFILSAVLGFQGIMVGWLFLRDLIPWLPRWVFFVTVPILMLGKVVLFYVIGYLWDKERIFTIEQEWHNRRNDTLMRIKEATNAKRC